MKHFSVLLAVTFFYITTFSQSKKQQDITAIKSMCGCYEVSFNFAETFSYSKDSSYVPSSTKHDTGMEYVELIQDDENKISLQHILIVDAGDGTPYIIKHWRQDWEYENTDFYMFDHDNKWKYTNLPKEKVAGQWTQKVYQVNDSPRYSGTASWIHLDGKSYWENTTPAPLPRREYTKRNDYNITVRTNRHEIVPTGWIHDQDNEKVIREEGKEDVLLAREKGTNYYVKVAENKCESAKNWWKDNADTWAMVRSKWEEVLSQKKDLHLAERVEGKNLTDYLFYGSEKLTPETVNDIIEKFVQ